MHSCAMFNRSRLPSNNSQSFAGAKFACDYAEIVSSTPQDILDKANAAE